MLKDNIDKLWWYSNHKENITFINVSEEGILADIRQKLCKADIFKGRTMIDWEKGDFVYFFNFFGKNDIVKGVILQSIISKEIELVISLGDGLSFQTKCTYFIENWEGFWSASSYMGFFVTNVNHDLVMEFSEEGFLHSNFFIAP